MGYDESKPEKSLLVSRYIMPRKALGNIHVAVPVVVRLCVEVELQKLIYEKAKPAKPAKPKISYPIPSASAR